MAENTLTESSKVAPWAISDDSSILTTTTHHLPDGSIVRVSALYMIKLESPGLKDVVGEAIDRWLSKTEHCLFLFDGIKQLGNGFYVVTLLNMQGAPLLTFMAECTSNQSSSTLVPSDEQKVKDLSHVFATAEHFRFMLYGSNSKGSDDPSFSILFAGSAGFGALRQQLLERVGASAHRADISAAEDHVQKPSSHAHEAQSSSADSPSLQPSKFPLAVPNTGTIVKRLNLGDSVMATVIKNPKSMGGIQFNYLMGVMRGDKILGFVSIESSAIAEMLLQSANIDQSDGNIGQLMLCSYQKYGHVNHGPLSDGNDLKAFLAKAIPIAQRIANVPEIDIEMDTDKSESKTDMTATPFVFGLALLALIVIIFAVLGSKL